MDSFVCHGSVARGSTVLCSRDQATSKSGDGLVGSGYEGLGDVDVGGSDHPSASAHCSNRVRSESASDRDEQRITAALVDVGQPRPPSQFPPPDDPITRFDESQQNRPFLGCQDVFGGCRDAVCHDEHRREIPFHDCWSPVNSL